MLHAVPRGRQGSTQGSHRGVPFIVRLYKDQFLTHRTALGEAVTPYH